MRFGIKQTNLDLPAQYWLKSSLSAESVITDGFMDVGYAGSATKFPTLAELQNMSIDSKREVLLVDSKQDPKFVKMVNILNDNYALLSLAEKFRAVAVLVFHVSGGHLTNGDGNSSSYRFRIAELKNTSHSNIILIGSIDQGTFYHRALLFKALADRLGLTPCSVVRGEYGRAWNVINPKLMNHAPRTERIPTPGEKSDKSEKQEKADRNDKQAAANRAAVPLDAIDEQFIQVINSSTTALEIPDGPCIIDLMYEPGELILLDTPKANEYQRI